MRYAKEVAIAIAASPLPPTGRVRWSRIAPHLPVSKGKYREMVLDGRAPAPYKMGARLALYDLVEIHKFLADPANYKAD